MKEEGIEKDWRGKGKWEEKMREGLGKRRRQKEEKMK